MLCRIDKILSSQNVASRSQIKQMIKKKQVTVDGTTVKSADEKYDPEQVTIAVDGKPVAVKKHIYIMMNKPKGIISASEDKREKTVIDLLPQELKRRGLFPAGRLDRDTEGFLLITDDGELAHKMLSPKNHVYKLYYVETDRPLPPDIKESFKRGITLGEESFLPCDIKQLSDNSALVEICEGKFHQIKKMFHAVGTEVTRLKRLRMGGVFLDESLMPGNVRELTEQEKIDILSRKKGI